MKKIRLFSIAAAMGMFASTVSAAEYVTKEAYVATWGKVDEIIKVDVGDKVVLPFAEINVVKETRTTDPKYATNSDSLGLEGSEKCFAGFTNEEGKDTNGDGYVDAKILTAGITNLTTQGWLHTDAKFFPSAKTALYYVGLPGGSSVTGGRFLAPGAAANKGFYTQSLKHNKFADENEVIKFLEDNKFIDVVYDGNYIDYVNIRETTVYNDSKSKQPKATVALRLNSTKGRNSDAEIMEAILAYAIDGTFPTPVTGTQYTREYVGATTYATTGDLPYRAVKIDGKTEFELGSGDVLVVEENRYGDLWPVSIEEETGIEGKKGYITIVVKNNSKFTKFATLPVKTYKEYDLKAEYVWDETIGTFVKKSANDVAKDTFAELEAALGADNLEGKNVTVTEKTFKAVNHAYGLYFVTGPANPTDKIVINTDGLSLDITGINTKDSTMTIAAADGKELKVSAVRLGTKWYPAVNTEAELTKFVEKVLGLTSLKGEYVENKTGANEFDKWVELYEAAVNNPLSGVSMAERTNVKGEKEEYIPQNSMQHYKGTFCTYKSATGEAATATVTGNVESVDTTTSGVKTLTLTAKVGDAVVATKDVKVVVAPKYERVYKNGKVVTLKAFHLNGNLYAVYNYDWAGKKYTASFYAPDGVTVASTANGTL